MKIEKSGWYDEDMNLVAQTEDEMVEYLEGMGDLEDIVTQYICDNFDMEDFISEIMYDREYMNRECMIDDFKDHELVMGEDFSTGREWYEWFEEGTELDEENE